MTITLELSLEEETALSRRAQAQGTNLETVLHDLVAQIDPQSPTPELTDQQNRLAALLQTWAEEDKADDPDELDRRDHEMEEFKDNMNRWRAEEGKLPVY